MTKRILIAGGTGLIGSAVTQLAIAQGYEVVLLSRTPGHGRIGWDPAKGLISITAKETFTAIINLAGASIADKRWTARRREEIVNSRINSCRTIRHYINNGLLTTSVYIGASGIGYYGNSGTATVDEKTITAFPDSWMVRTVEQWETAHHQMEELNIRTVILRIGIVLSMKSGALKEILNPAKFGLLATFGNGKQIMPWIHITDLARIILYAIEQEAIAGVFVAVAPKPVSNKELVRTIHQKISKRNLRLPAPRVILMLMLGSMHKMLFDSCNAFPTRLLHEKFNFSFPEISGALENIKKERV